MQRDTAGTGATPRPEPETRTRFFEIIPHGTHFRFVRWWRACTLASLLVILLSAVAVPLRGVQLGVDFAGGHLIRLHVPAAPGVGEGDVRAALERAGVVAADVTRFGERSEGRFQVRFPAVEGVDAARIGQQLERELAPIAAARIESIDFVGPRMGADLRRSAMVSMGIALALILVYVALRFSSTYAPGAVVALVHDVLVTAGIFVICGWEFDLDVVAALLTIVGYSLNDTIVVYDRIRELRQLRGDARLADVIDAALNETLSRTLLTAGTTLLALLALLLLAGPRLSAFSVAMSIGIVVGTYSSVYVAAPLVMVLEGWKAGRSAAPRPGARPAQGGAAR